MTNVKSKAIIATAVVLLLVTLIGTAFFYNSSQSMEKSLNNEKLKSENILSEKLSLQREIADFKTQISELQGKNSELDKVLAETSKKLGEKEAMANSLIRENGNIKMLKKQLSELNKMKKDFENQVTVLNETIQNMSSEKTILNQTIASLQKENKELAANLDIISSMTADNYLIESNRKNGKLTVMSKRTKKMAVSFKVPENIVENISFKITKPDGITIEGKDKGIAYTVSSNGDELLASISTDEIKVSKKIEMTYEPKEKLKPGVYKVEMFNGKKYIGACNVKLR